MPPHGYTSQDMAEDLETLLADLGVGAVHLVGHSFGGATALHLAVLRPDLVTTLILADARLPAFEEPMRLQDWAHWREWSRRLGEEGVEVPDGQQPLDHRLLQGWAQLALRRTPTLRGPERTFVPYAGWAGTRGSGARLDELLTKTTAGRDLSAVAGLTPQLIATAAMPTLALYGEYSHCLASLAGLRRNVRDCKTRILPRVGHFFPFVQPELFASHVRAFLLDHHNEATACSMR